MTDLIVPPGISAPLSAAPRHEHDAIQRRDPAQPDLVRDHRTVPSLLTSATVVAVVVAAVAAECACQWER